MEPKQRKRTPVSRAEGERRFVDAAIELARERPFGELSAREIARRADMNHGYVHVWFGSKAGLIAAACEVQAQRLLERLSTGSLSVEVLRDPEVELMFRLLGRLQTEPGGPELASQRRRPIVGYIAAQLQAGASLAAEDAQAMAELAVAAAAGVATVGEVLHVDVQALVSAWPRLLVGYREASASS